MTRAIRLTAGWAVSLVGALALSLLLAPPTMPQPVAVAVLPSPTPVPAGPAAPDPSEVLPPFPHWPPPGGFAGSARPVNFAPMAAADGAALQSAADRLREELRLQALTVGISVGGRAWSGASGMARDGSTVLDGDSPFAIASITKTFTATLVLQLVEEGLVGLDDPVAAHLPDVPVPPGVTVRQLLAHTSGVADLLMPMREPMNTDAGRVWTAAEVIGRLPGPWFSAGADYGYSNSNYVLLGMLVERISGRTFAEEVAERLLRPLHLDETGVLLTDGAPLLIRPSWASAFGTSGFMYSSASDLLEWAAALYGGRVLERATLAEMLLFTEDDYGLGTERIELGDRLGYGHSGLLQGFTSLLVHLPQERITLIVIGTSQGFDPAAALAQRVDELPSILDLALGELD